MAIHRNRTDHLIGLGRANAHSMGDLDLFLIGRMAHDDLHEKAVPLGFRQRIHTLRLNGILGRQDEKRRAQSEDAEPLARLEWI